MCRRFSNTVPSPWVVPTFPNSLSRQCSETSAHEIQPPDNHPKESLQYTFISPTNQILKTALLLNSGHCHVEAMGTAVVRQAFCACVALLKTVTYHECDCWYRDMQWNLLTVWSRFFLLKLKGSQPAKKFPAFYGKPRFITAFTRACHLSLSSARSIQSMPHPPTIPLPKNPS